MTTKSYLLSLALDQVYPEGKAAYLSGVPRDSCPWNSPVYRCHWLRGWLDAQADAGFQQVEE